MWDTGHFYGEVDGEYVSLAGWTHFEVKADNNGKGGNDNGGNNGGNNNGNNNGSNNGNSGGTTQASSQPSGESASETTMAAIPVKMVNCRKRLPPTRPVPWPVLRS
ncbi:hypothetical protein JIR001_17450 [Polycladomyces abyssicola]|uniref:Uncharacterized protein n=1 Tax=Polycladomyces abyssicola TaxID=1125966 RepID=A0A8D5ZNH9_9BACL|nr:hypothetical protein JIR001_17450 [Polycladomyces abyssicola]